MAKNNNIRKLITFNKGINLDTNSRSLLKEDECWENANVLLTQTGAKMVKSDVTRETATITSGGTKVRLWEHYETRTDYDTVTGGKRLVLYSGTPDLMITNSSAMKFSTSKLDCDTNFDVTKPIRAAELNGGMYFVDGTNKVKKIFGAPLKNAVSSSPGDLAPGAGYQPLPTGLEYKANQTPVAIDIATIIGNKTIFAATNPKNLVSSPNVQIKKYSELINTQLGLDDSFAVQADDAIYYIDPAGDTKVWNQTTSHYNDLGAGNIINAIQKYGDYFYLTYTYSGETFIYKFKFNTSTTTPLSTSSYKIATTAELARLYISNDGTIYYQLEDGADIAIIFSTDLSTSVEVFPATYEYPVAIASTPSISNSVQDIAYGTIISESDYPVFTLTGVSSLRVGNTNKFNATAGVAASVVCRSISYDSSYFYVLAIYNSVTSRVYKIQLESSGASYPKDVVFTSNILLCTLANDNATVMVVKNGYGYYSTGNNVFYQFNLATGATLKTCTIADTTTQIAGLCLSADNAYIYLTDNNNHRVGRYTLADDTYYFFGSYGAGPGQFNNPIGIQEYEAGTIAVCDSENYRIQLVEFFTNTIYSVYTIEDYQPPKVKPVVALDTATTNPITQGSYYLRYSYLYRNEMGYVESRQTEQMQFDVTRNTSGITIYLEASATAKYTNIYISTPTSPDFVLLKTIEADKTSVHLLGLNLDNKPFLVPYASRPPAGCQIVSEHHNRMWYTKDNRIYISSMNRPDYCPDIFFDDTPPDQGGWIDVGNGEAITGLGMYGGFVFVYKNRGMWRISGDPGQQNFGMSPVDDAIGCDSHETIQLCENSILCWLGNNSVYAFNGERVIELAGIRKLISALTTTQKQTAYAVYYPDKHWYEITFPADGASAAYSYRYQFDVGGKWVRNTGTVSTGHTVVLHSGSAIGANVNASASASLVLYDKFTGTFSDLHHETKRWEEPLLQRKQVVGANIIIDYQDTANSMVFQIAIGSRSSYSTIIAVTVPAQATPNLYTVQVPFRFAAHKVNALEFSIYGGSQALLYDITIVGVEIIYAVGGSSSV